MGMSLEGAGSLWGNAVFGFCAAGEWSLAGVCGFAGAALASVAAVSKLTVKRRDRFKYRAFTSSTPFRLEAFFFSDQPGAPATGVFFGTSLALRASGSA
jgi:hypothetical protein